MSETECCQNQELEKADVIRMMQHGQVSETTGHMAKVANIQMEQIINKNLGQKEVYK